MNLLRTLILRPLRRDLLRTALTMLAVALGVAVVVAIDLASDAATGSFRSSLETLAGKTDLEITANGGIDEHWMAQLATLPLNARFAPLVETHASLPREGAVPLYGVDALGEAGIGVSEGLAKQLGVAVHQPIDVSIAGRWRRYEIARIVKNATADFLTLDIAEAQQALERYGKLDRIDIEVAPDEDFGRVEEAVRKLLPSSYLIQRPGARSDENQRMLRAFRWNLRVLSYISLVVGAFLIYNTISISVVRRRAEIGILRAIGAPRGTVFGLFLAEALLIGVAGAVLGIALGRALAGGTVRLVAVTVNALFTTSRPAPVALTWQESVLGLTIGALAALLSAFGPAREAMDVHPAEAMSRGAREHAFRLRWRRGLAWAAALGLLAFAASQAGPVRGFPLWGYAAAFLCVGAVAFASPAFVLAVNRVGDAWFRPRVEGLLARRGLVGSLSRTSVVVAALATAISMMVSVGIMVGSFRETVALWLAVQLRADLYVSSVVASAAGTYPPLAPQVAETLASTPGVAAADVFHALELHYRGERATLGAGNMDIVRRYGRLRFLRGEDRDAVLRSLPGNDRAVVSEPFANRFGIRAGDRITLPLGASNATLTVAGIYYDYSSSQGYVIVDNSTLRKYLPDQPATNVAVYLKPGADLHTVERELRLRTAGLGVNITRNSDLRRISLEVFDRTFTVTWGLEAVAIIVAMLGAANSLLAVVLDRRRELGMLKYLGASAGQIRGMILTEAALIGGLAAAAGLALGFALSLLLVFVVNKQSFGWTIQFHPPGALLAGALLLVWCVTALAGLYPARVASRLNPVEAIHEE
jgi:putative ABC transport system permease protein